MTDWDERFRSGQYPRDPEPAPLLKRHLEALPGGRALDIAAGTGRNAVFLAANGYQVDAVDGSRVGLDIARQRAADLDVVDNLECINADIPSYAFPTDTYDLVTISFYRALDRFSDIKASLVDGGCLFVEHHLRTTDSVASGPSGDRYRFAANELLHSALDLTILSYTERTVPRPDGRTAAVARLFARNCSEPRQSYPRVADDASDVSSGR